VQAMERTLVCAPDGNSIESEGDAMMWRSFFTPYLRGTVKRQTG